MKCHHVVNLFAASWPERNPPPRLRQNHQPPHAAASAEAGARRIYADGWGFVKIGGGGVSVCPAVLHSLYIIHAEITSYIYYLSAIYNSFFPVLSPRFSFGILSDRRTQMTRNAFAQRFPAILTKNKMDRTARGGCPFLSRVRLSFCVQRFCSGGVRRRPCRGSGVLAKAPSQGDWRECY